MKQPKFIIASTGRSGSRYISQVLTKAGIKCGHEDWFTSPARNKERESGLIGDSSCFSVPHLADYDGIVFHQVRNPLHVLTSLYENRKRIKSVRKIWRFRRQFIAEQTGYLMRDFMQMIVGMNEEIEEHADIRYAVERLYDWEQLFMFFHYNGLEMDKSKAAQSIRQVSKNCNKHHKADYLTWDDIEDCREKELLMKQAQNYGYC